jgi:3',5'-cyclic AMP phosphodiesterase CpdA
MPVYLMAGNHDDRDALRSAFADHGYLPRDGTFLQYVVDADPLRLIALDTVVPGKAGGLMCDDRIGWLAARLAEAPDRPTVIFMHHPPFKTGIEHMDRIGLDGAEKMGEIVRRHPRIEAVLCGHLHRPIQTRWCGTVASTAPSTAHQVTLDLRDGGPGTFTMEPPAFLIHAWRDDMGLVTHMSYVGDFAGPYPFL